MKEEEKTIGRTSHFLKIFQSLRTKVLTHVNTVPWREKNISRKTSLLFSYAWAANTYNLLQFNQINFNLMKTYNNEVHLIVLYLFYILPIIALKYPLMCWNSCFYWAYTSSRGKDYKAMKFVMCAFYKTKLANPIHWILIKNHYCFTDEQSCMNDEN